MTAEDTERALAFWAWFAVVEARTREDFAGAVATRDLETLKLIGEAIGLRLEEVSPALFVRLGGGARGTFHLEVLARTEAADGLAAQVMAVAPSLDGWTFGPASDDPVKNVIARDQDGQEVVVPCDEVRFLLLPPQADGTRSILLAWDAEFDPRGPLGHLYHSAARQLIESSLGRVPAGCTWALVPPAFAGGRELRPLGELATAWRARG